jgi:hypothetical protein
VIENNAVKNMPKIPGCHPPNYYPPSPMSCQTKKQLADSRLLLEPLDSTKNNKNHPSTLNRFRVLANVNRPGVTDLKGRRRFQVFEKVYRYTVYAVWSRRLSHSC